MKVYTEILKQFVGDLPAVSKIQSLLINHAFEVEEVISVEGGDVLDLKVLPDRAHDALSHRGIAREIATHAGIAFNEVESDALIPGSNISPVVVKVESDLCSRYMVLRLKSITVTPSPEWLARSLKALDQKSINTLVDLTNYILLELGQPLHVFDADKIKGTITVRMARDGETMTTLDNKEVSLSEEMLVIADDEGVLALAGIKGGKKAEVDADTKSIILECANFDSISVRKTAFKVGIRTDASKRFENNYPAAWAQNALLRYVYLLKKKQPQIIHSEVVDVYPNPRQSFTSKVSTVRTNQWLGTNLSSDEVSSILTKLHLPHVEKESGIFEVTCDDNLFNIRSVDDQKYVAYQIIGHIGRVIGYDTGIQEKEYVPLKTKGMVVPYIAETDRIRNELVSRGFVEVRTYHFQNEGEEELENPLANDKKFIRSSLQLGMSEALVKATYNAPLLGRTDILIFEIGTVVSKEKGEQIHLAVTGFKQNQKKQKLVDVLKHTLLEIIPSLSVVTETDNYVEVIVASHNELFEPTEKVVPLIAKHDGSPWQSLSKYPHVVRDVAFFTSPIIQAMDKTVFEENLKEKASSVAYTGPNGFVESHCVRVDMFDEFEKVENGIKKFSRAYRFVFQASDHTLTEDTIKLRMHTIENYLRELGCEIR